MLVSTSNSPSPLPRPRLQPLSSTACQRGSQLLGHLSASEPVKQRRPFISQYYMQLRDLLKKYPSTAEEIRDVLSTIRSEYPDAPLVLISYSDGPWPFESSPLLFRHLIHNFEVSVNIARNNVIATGRRLDSNEEKYLRYLMVHPWSWSPTTPEHHRDSWVQYIEHQYPHTSPLTPILDSLTWPEEANLLPETLFPGTPSNFFLANATSYYLYDYETDELVNVGNTLKDVYMKMKEGRFLNHSIDRWVSEPENGEEHHAQRYFPDYVYDGDSGDRRPRLAYPIMPFDPQASLM